jgi:hypothetical protein
VALASTDFSGSMNLCGDGVECDAQLCFPVLSEQTGAGLCFDRFGEFDTDVEPNVWSPEEYAEYAAEAIYRYGLAASTLSFEQLDLDSDGAISRGEFQLSGSVITSKAPFFEISDVRLELPKQGYALVFSAGDLALTTAPFDVTIGDPFAVQVESDCPTTPPDARSAFRPCGIVGQFLAQEFRASLRDAVGNLRQDLDGVLVQVSIPKAYTTPGAVVQGSLAFETQGGQAAFPAASSIRLDKVPPNPEIGYKLQFDALSPEFPAIGTGISDFFRIEAEAADTIGVASQVCVCVCVCARASHHAACKSRNFSACPCA